MNDLNQHDDSLNDDCVNYEAGYEPCLICGKMTHRFDECYGAFMCSRECEFEFLKDLRGLMEHGAPENDA